MESYIIESNKKKSRLPARLDLAQSGTGLILGLFMWVHMLLVGSIIFGKAAFNFVAKTMELAFLSDTGHGYPIAVFFAVSTIFTLFIIHALLGMRKFPINWKQHRIMRDQMQMMNHTDTNLWYIQAVTGFIMFFAGSVHLYIMLTNPASIGPYMSADRVVSGNMWPLYLILLICVELHGGIGLYRLCMKWGWFTGKDARKSREKLKKLKNRLTIFFLTLGILALLVFVVIGIKHRDKVGEKYEKLSAVVEQVDIKERV
ncbi:MAG: fumarate reductase cytochrome b subunit [Desulfobacteraceae bacterium]|nr:MAG: fumarate reductase cytochrome b subunit [Desulfobacteraceae bacterium]